MGKHDNSRSSSRSLSRNQIECKSDIRKRRNSLTSSYKQRKRRKCSPSPSRSGSKITLLQDKSRKYSSELHLSGGTKKHCKRDTSSSSTNSSRSRPSNDSGESRPSSSSRKKRLKHERKQRSKRDSSSSESEVSSSSGSTSSCSDSSAVAKKKRRKEKKRRKDKKRRRKEKKAKRKLKRKKERLSVGPEINPIEVEMATASNIEPEDRLLTDRAKAMAPMTKEEWDKRQSVIRRVFDEETGRHRLIKGDGEVLEEIVSRDRHREINRQATKGDGDFFQATLAAKQFK